MRSTETWRMAPASRSEGSAKTGDRRRAPRTAGEGMVCLALEDQTARARLIDHSEGGLRIKTRAALILGDIVYCAVPSLAVCSRARVVHVKRGLLGRTAGLQYLAALADWN